MRPLVVYHSPCLDGFTAAWAMWLKYPDAEFVPGVYGQEPPDCTDRKVYLLDFSYKLPVMQKIIEQAEHVIVLDHHKTAQAIIEPLFTGESDIDLTCGGVFDMEKSGARLAWEWFHPGTEVPWLVKFVEDRDLWRFALEHTREVNAALFSYDYDFDQWNQLRATLINGTTSRFSLIAEGRAIERKHQKDVAELIGKLRHEREFYIVPPERPMQWNGVVSPMRSLRVPCANLPYTYASDAAGLMAEDAPFAATYYQDADGWFVFSLRSREEDGADVSAVATVYGGGGHKHAAGFRIQSLEEL